MTSKIFSLCLMAALSGVKVAAEPDVAIRALLSHGHELATGETCTYSEWDTIVDAMDDTRRTLRGEPGRVLYPSYCNNVCQGFPPFHCHLVYSACHGIRRRRLAQDGTPPAALEAPSQETAGADLPVVNDPELRELTSVKDACAVKIASINAALDRILLSLSSDCQIVLGAGRDFSCFEVNTKDILRFKSYNADSDEVIDENFEDGDTICESQSFNIEAVAGSEVSTVKFELNGEDFTQKRLEKHAAWMAFGNSGSNMFGQNLNAGSYKVSATPDKDSSKTKTVSFEVLPC